ncbi:MAG: polysaccharide biosynthesis protein [Muribaculaceae bacterium]|nr:polysaccharide biosynthesis protein [Muribaculaceae bacterium]
MERPGAKNSAAATPPPGRWRKLVGDMGVYAIGNLGAKVLTFLMVPLYTYYIPDTAAFGYFDICLTAAFLLSPLVTLDLRDGVFRFLLDAPDEASRRRVATAAAHLLARSLAVALAVLLGVACVVRVQHQWLALLLLLGVVANDLYGQLLRGLGRNRLFVAMGLATAVLVVLLSVVLVGWMRMGIEGIFWANAAARLLPMVAIEVWPRLAARLFVRDLAWRSAARELLRYTVPLIPAMLIWWMLSFGDRWVVRWVAGPDANGVYAVAARLTGVVYTFTVIIQQAWQETAILQYRSDDRDSFFSQIFAAFIYLECLVVMVYVVLLRLNYGWLIDSHYAASVAYLFPLAVGAAIYSTANFLEMGYQCACDTRRLLLASIATGVVYVALNVALAPLWGVWGVIASSIGAFLFLAVWRLVDTRRYFTLRPGWRVAVPVAMMLVVGAAGYLSLPLWADIVVSVAAVALTLCSLPRSLYNKFKRIPLVSH